MENLYLNKEFVIVHDNEKYYIAHRHVMERFDINKDSFQILKYIHDNDGVNTQELEGLSESILNFIDYLLSHNVLIKDENQRARNNIKEVKTKPGLTKVFFEVTKKCNMHCRHCYNESGMDTDNQNQLTLEEVKSLIDEAHELGVWQFDLTGGELFLRKDIYQILEYLDQRAMAVNLFTNLTLLNREKIEQLKNYNIKRIVTSLDGFTDELHDSFRGLNGSRKKITENIKLLKENNFSVLVNVVIGDHNIHEIDDLVNYLKFDLQVSYTPDILVPLGRGNDLGDQDKYVPIVGYLKYLQSTEERCSVENMTDFEPIHQTFCGIAEKFIFITNDGYGALCPSLTYRENQDFCFGNLRERSLPDIWNELIRRYGKINCNKLDECEANDKCSGGCRSRAYALYGSIENPDKSYCALYNIQHTEKAV